MASWVITAPASRIPAPSLVKPSASYPAVGPSLVQGLLRPLGSSTLVSPPWVLPSAEPVASSSAAALASLELALGLPSISVAPVVAAASAVVTLLDVD